MNGIPRVAVIGIGYWGKNLVRVIHQLGSLVAVVELDDTLRNRFCEQYQGVAVYQNHLDVINSREIDAIVIATPANTHYNLAKTALQAGKDVLVEKPMTLSVEESEELVSIAEDKKRVLMVGHLLLYKSAVKKVIEYVQSGRIGELRSIEMRRLKLGKVRSYENVFWSFAPHDIAVLLTIVRSPLKKLNANGMAAIQGGVEDDVQVHIEFENGVQAHIHSSWIWPEDERKTVIIGTEGMLIYDEHENKVWLHQKGVKQDLSIWDQGRQEIQVESEDALEIEVLHFLHCINSRTTPLTDGKRGADVVKILVQVGKALKENESEDYFAHESAYLDYPVKIGKGTGIWHFSHVMTGAEIGERCKIGQNVLIARNVKIGNNVKIQNNVSVYEGVILEDDVFCGSSMVFTNVKTPRSAFPRNTSKDYLTTHVKQGASIGANATIVCGVTIGKYALIGAGSLVSKDVPDYAVVYGNPAQIRGRTCKCSSVVTSNLDVVVECCRCGTRLEI